MSQSIQLQVTQVGLEQSIAAAMKRVGSSSQINLGTNSKQINALSQPLGRITGQADEFSKSMAAANARVLAFGASAGIIAGVSKAMSGLLTSTIKVEKSLVEINSVLNETSAGLDKFGQDIFNVAKNTGKSFDEVAKGALELARQGLNTEDTLARLNDALILSRLSGLDAAQSVEGLTAAFNSFKKSGITTAEILNKVVAVSQEYAVSERDIIEGLKRSASVADLAGVSFEELAAVITAVQEKTARGGAVIGNAFKTIFSRIQDKAVLSDLQGMGVAVTDLQGEVLPALRILENLAKKMEGFSQIERADISKKLGGVYQLDKLLATLSDLSDEASVTAGALKAMGEAGSKAYQKNAVLNQTLAALLNKVAVSAEQLGAKLGEIGVTDSLKNVLGFFNGLLEGIQKVLGEESGLGNLVRGLVKGLGSFLAGPGLALFGAIILKLSKDLVQFGFASLKAFFGIGKAAKEVQNVEGSISQILAKNVNLQQQLFALEGNRAAQLRVITSALVEQEAVLRRSSKISSGLAAPLYNVGARATGSGLRVGNSADGYMPAVAKESKAIKQGVGGARSGDRPVVMPNFNFGGGKKGTMVAHTGEYVVPNFNGSGGSAVFNRQMVRSMGLPSGAKKIGAAGGFVPNFVEENSSGIGPKTFLDQFDLVGSESPQQIVEKINSSGKGYFAEIPIKANKSIQVYTDADRTRKFLPNGINIQSDLKTKLLAVKNSYNAEANPNEAVMLIPQDMPYRISGANTDFSKDNIRKIGNNTYSSFRGATAGVRSNLTEADGKNFEKISKIDTLLEEGLSKAAFSILSEVEPGIKLPDNSPLKPENIKNVLEAGGKGAFGALRGALFETVISQVARAKGRSFARGSLDIDFEAGDENSRKVIETIFGLPKNKYEFADLKNSIDQKDKYIDQVMTYLPKDQNIALAKKVSSTKGPNAAGGYIPNFAAQRNVGYLDGDVLSDPRYAATVKEQIAKLGIKGGTAEYHKYLGDLVSQARASGKLKKFTGIYGVPGAGKSTMMFGGGIGPKADAAKGRKTNRIPIITPEDIAKVSEVVDTRASLLGTMKALEGGYLSNVDRMMILSSSTPEEQAEIKRRRNLRDAQITAGTSATAFGRTAGTSQGAALDSGYIEAMALSILGPDKVSVMGIRPDFKLARKKGSQLPLVDSKKIGLAYGAFSPSTKGHAELLKMAQKEGISPENFIAAVSQEGGTIDQNNPHSFRTALFPQGFRKYLMQKTVPGANVIGASQELFAGSIPRMFETSSSSGQRRFIKAQQGSLAFVGSDKTEKDLEKYIRSGYDVRVGDRTTGISGTAAREAIDNLDSKSIAEIFTKGAVEVINQYLPQMKNRSNIFPEIIKRVNSKVDNQLNPIEQALSLLPARKSKTTPPEVVAQMEELREARDKLKKLKQKIPNVMLRKLGKLFPDKYGLPSAADGYVPNFALNGSLKRAYDLYKKIPSGAIPSIAKTALTTNPLNIAKTGLFAAKAAKTFGVTMPKGGKLDIESIWGHLTNFVQNPENLIKNQKDLMDAKTAIQTILNNDILRDRFAKFAAKRVNTEYYNNKNVIVGTQDTRPSETSVLDSSMRPVARPIGKGSSMSEADEEYLKYRLFGGTSDLKDYDGKKPSEYYQKGKFLKFYQKSSEVNEIRGASYEASMIGMSNKHVSTRPRMLDKKGRYYGISSLMGGFTGRLKQTRQGGFASYRDVWDIALHSQEKKILDDYLNNRTKPSKEILSSTNAYQPIGSSLLDFNIGPYILRELVSSIPKARPVEFRGVTGQGTNEDFYDGYAGGFIPNFAGGTPNRALENAKRLLEKLKPLTGIAKTLGFDQFLGAVLPNGISPIEQDLVGKSLEQVIPAAKAGFQDLMNRGIGVSVSTREMGAFQSILKDLIDLDAGIPLRSGSHINDPTPMIQGLVKRARIAHKQIKEQARRNIEGGAAGGFLPNFANPLQAAVGREMAAGVPASQIYIDKSPALKNAANPMGLMVANRRDEPAGGFQGINRARREGANPMMYGASGGFVPNYANRGVDSQSVSQQLGGLPNVKGLDIAIDQFGQSIKKAGADIDKLAQGLKSELENLKVKGAVNKMIIEESKKQAESFKQEKAARDESIKAAKNSRASKVLESESTKKLAKKLDKIYLEYNKSEKTTQDLQKAQAKAAAALNKTSLGPRTQAAVVANTESLASNRKNAQPGVGGNRDMLGSIFALQGAMSALTGATSDATEGIGKYANAVSEGISSFATAAFAIQGLGALGGPIGKFVSALGPAGLAAAGVFAAFKIGKAVYEEYSGANKRAANSAILLSQAAEKAAYSLDQYSAQGKKDVENTVNNILKNIDLRGVSDPEMAKIKEAVTFAVSAGASNQSIIKSLEKNTKRETQTTSLGASATGVPNSVTYDYRSLKQGDSETVVRELGKLGSEGDVKSLSTLQSYITQGKESNLINSLPGLESLQSGGDTAKKIAELTKDPTNIQKAIADLNTASSKKIPLEKIEGGASELAKLLEAEDTNRARTIDFLEKIAKYREEEAKRKGEEAAESDRSFKINLGKIQAQAALENRLTSFRKNAKDLEIAKLEEIERIQNDNLLTEDQRAKKIAQANYGYDQNIQSLQTIEQKTKNIEQALIDSVSSGLGIVESEIASTVATIQSKLPEFNASDLDSYINSVKEALKSSGVALGNQKAIVQALIDAEVVNNGINAQQREALEIAAKKLGIELKTLKIARDRSIEEAKINSMMESAKSIDNFNLEKRSLDIAYDTLSINKQIEKVKRDSSLNELEKAKQIFKLEEKRVGLEKSKITVDYDKSANDAAEEFKNSVLSTAKEQFGIQPRTISGSLSGGAEEVIKAARAKISDTKEQTDFDNLIADERKKYERDVELAKRRRDIDKSGVAPALESEVQRRARKGFSGGMEEGVNKLQDSINTFGFDIAEKIPQMFSDNMSSAINKMIEGGESFGDVLQGAAYEFVKGINQANIQNLSNKFSNFLFKSDGGAKSGIASMLGMASGGKVTGGSGSKDDVPAMLMGGEYVVNKRAVSKYGPKFLEAINNGTLNGYAKGGKVQRGPQGNFYAPGSFGQGAISGKMNLLDFATQTGTSGKFDQMINESGYQSISLEPESSRLSVSGMRNSPMFDATQSAKGQAFDLYLQQYNAEIEAKKQAKEQKKALMRQVGMLALSAALGPVINAAGSGFSAAFKGADGQGFMSQVGAGFKGIVSGGKVGNQQVGGLSNLFGSVGKVFSGDFSGAANQFKLSQIGNRKQLLSAMKNKKFAAYINQQGGISSKTPFVSDASGISLNASRSGGVSLTPEEFQEIAKINAEFGISGPELDGMFLSKGMTKNKSGFNIFKSMSRGIKGIGSIFSGAGKTGFSSLNSGFTSGPYDKYGNYVEDWADDRSKWNIKQRATGGMIPSTSGIDTVPAMLSGGEFVMNRSAVQGIGAPNLQSMNSGGTSITSEETSKELNEKLLAKLDELIGASGSTGNITINVAPSGQTSQETSQDPSASRQQLARQIKDAVLQVINDEKRIGGSLRR